MTVVTDNFNRADALTLGSNWIECDGRWGIDSNCSYCIDVPTSERGIAYWNATFGDDQYAEGVFTSPAVQTGLCVRASGGVSGPQTAYVMVRVDPGNAWTYLFRIVADVVTEIGQDFRSVVYGDTFRLEADGTTIRVLHNGVEIISVTDTAITSGAPGLASYRDGIARGRWDAWEGGDASAPTVQVDDVGTGADATSGTYVTLLAETGAGVDALAGLSGAESSETGTGSDAAGGVYAASLSEAGSGADAVSAEQGVTVSETGIGTDAVSGALFATLAETGIGADAVFTDGSDAITVDDTGSGADSADGAYVATAAESGIGADSLSGALTAALSDGGAGSDTATGAGASGASESATGADTAAAEYAASLAESGAGLDAISALYRAILTEAGAGADGISVFPPLVTQYPKSAVVTSQRIIGTVMAQATATATVTPRRITATVTPR